MPVGFNSPARNLFLLGSSGAQVVTNFFKTIDQSAGTDGVYLPDEIKYIFSNRKYALAGSAEDSNSKGFGWFERQDYDAETDTLVTDYTNRIEATQAGVNTTLRAMELDANDNLIVVGKTADIPWIAKYSNGGVIDWSSTTNSADVEYTGITSDANGNYYACGSTTLVDKQAFVEKFDGSGNPGWGKSAFMLGRSVVLNKVAANTRGEVVAVGYLEDDTANKGYIVKIDTNTGEVLWDKTLSSTEYGSNVSNPLLVVKNCICLSVYIDSKDQIYVCGYKANFNSYDVGYIIKFTPEGNIIWQKEMAGTSFFAPDLPGYRFTDVKADGETEQVVVLSESSVGLGGSDISLYKFSKDGSVVFRRRLTSDRDGFFTRTGIASLDADPSFYYLLFVDQDTNELNGTPDKYTFGKVSTSGNGLGDFQYTSDVGVTIDYTYGTNTGSLSIIDGIITDGSVRNDTSDLKKYPFSANKILFDDLATHVANKKRQMDSADSFEYSGSPAIRPADFQELNLLGDVYSGSGDWLDQSGKGNDGKIINIWFKLIGGANSDYIVALDRDIYGNYYVSGATQSEGQGGLEGLITKWDSNGNLVWQRIIGGAGNETLGVFGIVVDNDNNCVYSGTNTISQGQGGADCLITKWDFDGNLIWQRILGGGLNDNIRSYKVDSSGNLYACGLTVSEGQGSQDALIIKIDPNGNLIWQKILGGTGGDVLFEIILDENDNIYCFGYANFVNPNADYLLTKWDTDGNLIWQKTLDIPGGNPSFNRGVFNQIDRCIYITGYDRAGVGSGFGSTDTALFKFDTDGKLIWQRILGGTLADNLQHVYTDGSRYIYAFGATSSEGQGNNDALITKWDYDGNLIWQRILGGTGNDFLYKSFVVNGEYLVTTLYTNTINANYNGCLLQVPVDLDQFPPQTFGGYFTLAESNLTVINYSPPVIPLSLTLATSTLTLATSTLTVATSTLPVTTLADPRPTHNAAGYWEFDGVDDYINIDPANINSSIGDSITIECWANTDNSAKYQIIGGGQDSTSARYTALFNINSTGSQEYGFDLEAAGGQVRLLSGSVAVNNTWAHLVGTYDGSTANFYLNGTLVDTDTGTSGAVNFFDYVSFGRDFGVNTRYFDGDLGEFRIYPRALTAAQVFQNYNATREKYTGVPASTDPGLTSTRTPA